MIDFFECAGTDERYDAATITLGEWHDLGFYKPLEDPSWQFDAYSDAQYERLCVKFLNRFYDRYVSIPTPSIWKRAYLRKLNEIMPKYKLLYKRVDAGIDPLQDSRDRFKSRDVFSDFPETMLSGNSDYASAGTDRESDALHEGNAVEMTEAFSMYYNDVDVMILDELEHVLFSGFITASVPMW